MEKRNEENKILVKLVKKNNRYYFYTPDEKGYYKSLGIYKTIKRVKEIINGTATNNFGEITPVALAYRFNFECVNIEDIEKFELEEAEAKKKAKADKKTAELKAKEEKENSINGAKESKFEVGETYEPQYRTFKVVCVNRTEHYATFDVYYHWNEDTPEETVRTKITKDNQLLKECVYIDNCSIYSEDCKKVKEQRQNEFKEVLNLVNTAEVFKRSSDNYHTVYKIARTEFSKAYYLCAGVNAYFISEANYNKRIEQFGEEDVLANDVEKFNEKIVERL